MKKLLQVVCYQYPHIGGIEQVARDIAEVLGTCQDVQQKIICFNENAHVGDIVCHRKETVHDWLNGVEVIRCGCFAKVASQSLSFSYPQKLYEVLKTFDPDIVILHYPNPYLTAFLLPMLKDRVKLYVYWHLDITKQKILGKVFHGQTIRLINRANRIVGATPKHIDESAYSKYFGDKKLLLPYMIDEQSLGMTAEEKEEAKKIREKYAGKKIGFFIGRHVPYKGLRYLIEASRILGDKNMHFIIAGSGELTEELKKQAKNDNKVEFVGRISDSERRAYLYACDIICFPSITRNEAFGLALAEGMYFEKPAVTFTIPGSGVNYVNLNGVTGIECPNCDSKAYAEALLKLAENDQLREDYGRNARQRVLTNFTEKQFMASIKKLVE